MSETGEKLFCLNVKLCIKPERREEFLANIANNQKGTTTTEPLAVTYLWGEDESTPNTFHFFEQYKGREGFEAHQKAPPKGQDAEMLNMLGEAAERARRGRRVRSGRRRRGR